MSSWGQKNYIIFMYKVQKIFIVHKEIYSVSVILKYGGEDD